MDETIWLIVRDESKRPLREKVKDCMQAYRNKQKVEPDIVGVSSSFSEEDKQVLEKAGVSVVHNLPAWVKDEIWVGKKAASGGS